MPASRVQGSIRFAISGDEGELIYPLESTQVFEAFDRLVGQVEDGKMSDSRYRQRLRELVKRHPWFVDAHLELARELIGEGEPERAFTHAMRAFQLCNRAIPKEFSGTIPWSRLENRPFLRAADCVAQCHSLLGERSKAIEIMQQQLAWNPNDNQGVRWLIGSVFLRMERLSEAEAVFQEHAAEYPPYHYELGLVHILREEWVPAATSIRRGIAANPYVAEMLCGSMLPLPLSIWHASSLLTPETAGDYLSEYGELWFEIDFAVSFVHWLFNHPKVLMERARLLDTREKLLWEAPGSTRNELLEEESEALGRVDDTLSEAIIQIRTDSYGGSGYPWEYPFESN